MKMKTVTNLIISTSVVASNTSSSSSEVSVV